MVIDLLIRNFRLFLIESWNSTSLIIKDKDTLSDWMQANWEILIETVVCKAGKEFLVVYGDGADCNGASSRVWLPDALPTHQVSIKIKNITIDKISGDEISPEKFRNKEIIFDKFVSWDGEQYDTNLPFNYVLASVNRHDILVNCDSVKFEIERVTNRWGQRR